MTFFFGAGAALDAGVGEGVAAETATRCRVPLCGGATLASPVVVVREEGLGRSGGVLSAALAESAADASPVRLVLGFSPDTGASVLAGGLFGETLSPPRTALRSVGEGAVVVADETFSPPRGLG
jgi:hypothetical protein